MANVAPAPAAAPATPLAEDPVFHSHSLLGIGKISASGGDTADSSIVGLTMLFFNTRLPGNGGGYVCMGRWDLTAGVADIDGYGGNSYGGHAEAELEFGWDFSHTGLGILAMVGGHADVTGLANLESVDDPVVDSYLRASARGSYGIVGDLCWRWRLGSDHDLLLGLRGEWSTNRWTEYQSIAYVDPNRDDDTDKQSVSGHGMEVGPRAQLFLNRSNQRWLNTRVDLAALVTASGTVYGGDSALLRAELMFQPIPVLGVALGFSQRKLTILNAEAQTVFGADSASVRELTLRAGLCW